MAGQRPLNILERMNPLIVHYEHVYGHVFNLSPVLLFRKEKRAQDLFRHRELLYYFFASCVLYGSEVPKHNGTRVV